MTDDTHDTLDTGINLTAARAAVALERNGHRTWLKWHRGRIQPLDAEFGPARISLGMRLGASAEIDLTAHTGGGFAVLHDETLERSTTGTGRVRDTQPDALRKLFLRDGTGAATDQHVMLLSDLAALVASETAHPDAVLQLDMKDTSATITPADIDAFVRDVAPVARHMLLSGGDPLAIAALSEAIPELGIGHDPCHDEVMVDLLRGGDYRRFVADALAASPRSTMIYLDHRLVLAAADRGENLAARFQDAGRKVDAYTIREIGPDTRPLVERLLALKVDQITTDDALALSAAFAG
ncbi:MAG: glycerophosphodiester phosphodiesterase [Pannonibacter sp.]